MPASTVSLFFALLALAANVVVIGWVVLTLARRNPAAARIRGRVRDELAGSTTGFAAIVAAVATTGSLYYSEVAHFVPCLLCWVQRAFMYPLAGVLTVAAWRRWPVRVWARTAALIGAGVSVWHLLVEQFPGLEGAVACDPANPCSLKWVDVFGFITIPYMALSAFLLIAVLLSITVPVPPPASRTTRQPAHDRAARFEGVQAP